jgi:hypothetical protein
MTTRIALMTTAILAVAINAADTKAPAVDTAAAFARLKSLAGEWEAKTPDGPAHLSYELTGAGTTLVENSTGPMPSMMTTYHLNGSRLMLTHYCMAGNQPRMQASSFDAKTGEIRFQFLDATNLANPGVGHMHNMTIRMIDHDHMTSEWEFFENGQKKMSETFEFTRIK